MEPKKSIPTSNMLLTSINDENSSNLISKYFLKDKTNSSINEQESSQNKPLEEPILTVQKIQKFFRKNIKLRNATIKKDFWERKSLLSSTSKSLCLKIIDMLPSIESTPGLLRCIHNYINNDNYEEFYGKVISESSSSSSSLATLSFIDNQSTDYNLFMKAKPKANNKQQNHMCIYKLIESAYKRVKKFKSQREGDFATNFFAFHRGNPNSNQSSSSPNEIIGKLYYLFPNINFELIKIKSISLSNKFQLNSLLIDKHKTHITTNKGIPLVSGFITMTKEKRVITLIDDTQKIDLKSSQVLKHIIFGIWINLKEEEVNGNTTQKEIDGIIRKHRVLIYRKCMEYIMTSSKIETIYSPSPDEGVFLLIIFFKGKQCHYEVKVIPNEEEKTIGSIVKTSSNGDIKKNKNEDETIDGKDDVISDEALGLFGNQWLIMRKKFTLKDTMQFDMKEVVGSCKICPMINYVNILQGLERSDSQMQLQMQMQIQMIQSKNQQNNNPSALLAMNNPQSSLMNKNFSNPLYDPLNELFDPPGIKKESNIINNQNAMNSKRNFELEEEEAYDYPYPTAMNNNNNGYNNSNNFIGQQQYQKVPSSTSNAEVEQMKQSRNNNQRMVPNNNNNNNNYNVLPSMQQDLKQSHKKVMSMNNIKMPMKNYYPSQSQSQSQQQNQVIKRDEGIQTISYQQSTNSNNDDNQLSQNQNNNSQNIQIQSLNNTISEQSQSIQLLTNKVNELEMLLNKVTNILKERENTCICQGRKATIQPQLQAQVQGLPHPQSQQQLHGSFINEEELEFSDDNDKLSESLQNSRSDDKEEKKNYILNPHPNNLHHDNNDGEKNKDTLKNNYDNTSFDVSSSNNNEKTIEVPLIKYNLTLLSNDNNDTAHDIQHYEP